MIVYSVSGGRFSGCEMSGCDTPAVTGEAGAAAGAEEAGEAAGAGEAGEAGAAKDGTEIPCRVPT